MLANFHFLRPYWLLAIFLILFLSYWLYKKKSKLENWSLICDQNLLQHLVRHQENGNRLFAILLLFLAAMCIIISLAGPTWSRLPVSVYKKIQPKILILDMSESMLTKDLQPDRLSRAKFKLHDLLNNQQGGQFGLVVYAGEAFVVSPLTDDAATIDTLLPSLITDIMPVSGNQLSNALKEAENLIRQAGFNTGQILVLTATIPDSNDLAMAKKLAAKDIFTSVMPIRADMTEQKAFENLAKNGQGEVITFRDTTEDLEYWLKSIQNNTKYDLNEGNKAPLWRDEGRWFLLPAIILLLPCFRRGWLERVSS